MMKTKKIFIIAGEASGDILGAGLMSAIKKKDSNVSFFGIGGEEMSKQQGFHSLFDIKNIAVMGIVEVIKNIFTIKKSMAIAVKNILALKPDMVITIDAPGFNIAVVKKVKKKLPNTIFVHYVAPQVWAWKEKRAKKISKIFDCLLCLFPFELKYFQKYGLKTFFVGHPALQNVVGDKNKFLEKYNFKNTDTIITLLPGTRQQMAEKLLPIFSDVVDNLRETIPNLKVVIPTIKNMEYFIFDKTRFWKVDPLIITGKQNRYDAFFASDVALAISGTSVLELAISKTPTVVAYKLSPITYAIAKHLVKIQNVTLPNIIMGKRIIPEFIQDECNAENLTKAILKILMDKECKRYYAENYEKMIDKLSGESPTSSSDKAAEVILDLLK